MTKYNITFYSKEGTTQLRNTLADVIITRE